MSESFPIIGENIAQEETGYKRVHTKSILVGLLIGTVVTALFMSQPSMTIDSAGSKMFRSSKVNMKTTRNSIKFKRESMVGLDASGKNCFVCWFTPDGYIECLCD